MSERHTESDNPEQHNSQRQAIRLGDIPAVLAWKVAAVLATALVVAVLFLDIIGLMIRPLGVLFAAIVVALTLAPIVDWLERFLPRLAAVLSVYFALILILVGFGFVLVPPVVTQAMSLVDNFPEHYENVQLWLAREAGMDVENDMEELASFAAPLADQILTVPMMVVTTGAEFLVGFFVSLYWLHSMPRSKAWVLSLFPPHRKDSADRIMQRVSGRMGGYMRGVVFTGVVVGTAVFVGLTILGLEYALLLALLAFLGEFFPNVGPILAGFPAVAIAFFESPGLAVVVLIFYLVIQQLESYILVPMVMMNTQAHIPPLVTTFAVFSGFFVGGVLWAILAIPLSGAILTLATDVIAPAIRERTGGLPPDSSAETIRSVRIDHDGVDLELEENPR
ncbi:MAG: AI-2E family transporter [Sphaerobacteraceae bacterium]|nr:MAG: AI-2E family transporter [Sphaerobacteraceae bacterium]